MTTHAGFGMELTIQNEERTDIMQKKHLIRIFSLLLAVMFVIAVFASCGNAQNESQADSGTEPQSQEESSKDENAFRLEKRDFGGEVIKILTPRSDGYGGCEIAASEITTEPVNDASYNRAKLISETYGLNVEQHFSDNVIESIRTQTESGLDEFQACTSSIYNLSKLAADGIFYDLKHIGSNSYIDLNQPYWDDAVTRDLSIQDTIYYATGDIVVTDDDATWAIFFNKDIMKNMNIMADYPYESIYDLVKDEKWTLDKLHEMAKKGTIQVSDGELVFGVDSQDTWGLMAQCYDSYAFTAGCGEGFIQRDGDGLRISLGDESNINAFRQVFDMMWDTSCVGVAEISGRKSNAKDFYGDELKIFENGKALFMPYRIGAVQEEGMREADIHYGLLPMPKLNELQDTYASTETVYWCTAVSIPLTNVQKFDATCYALELLAYYGKELMTPEYYDRTLKNKRFEDQESTEMLDMIFRNRTYDIGAVYNFGEILYFYTSILMSGENTQVSSLQKNLPVYQSAIDDFLAIVNSSPV